jgi:Archaeal/vacuolar-type H+-ATPase subunit E
MSLAQITEKIEQDARAEAQKILDRAKEQDAQIKRETDAEVKRLEDAAKERFERERPEIFKRRDIVANLDVNKIQLAARRQLIRDVFDEALKRLKKLDKDAYLAFCERLLKEAVASGGEELEVAKGEQFIDKAWVDAFNAANKTKVKLVASDQDFSGGFILNHGRVSINCSWEMLMQAAREKLETEVVKQLFPA